jgi:hypothetical protein
MGTRDDYGQLSLLPSSSVEAIERYDALKETDGLWSRNIAGAIQYEYVPCSISAVNQSHGLSYT